MERGSFISNLTIGIAAMLFLAVVIGFGTSSRMGLDVIAAEDVEVLDDCTKEKSEIVSTNVENVYVDEAGWSVKYPANVEVENDFGVVSFVLKGDETGSNLVTATYVEGESGKELSDRLTETWGAENTVSGECVFPGTENETGYLVSLTENEGEKVLYKVALARDYKDGVLVFEITGHTSGEKKLDAPVSSELVDIVDSVSFTN